MPAENSRRRLGLALLGYLIAQVAVITLIPFRFQWPDHFRITGFVTVADLVQNVALFVPIGFFAAFVGVPRPWLLGTALSLSVECLQEFLPGRYPSGLDLLANGAGTLLGEVAFRRLAAWLHGRPREFGIAALDLPLMGLVYLSLPLLWLSGLAAGSDDDRKWLVGLEVLTVAIVLASVGRHHLRRRGVPQAVTALVGGAGVAVGLLPGWAGEPLFIVVGAGVVVLCIIFLGDLLGRAESAGRRYEVVAVRRAMVPFGTYLVLTALWPLTGIAEAWNWRIPLAGPGAAFDRRSILHLLELIAAATVAGYAFAENRARVADRPDRDRLASVLGCVVLGLLLAGVRGFHERHAASVAEGLIFVAAAMAGGVLYRRQRDYVVSLLGRRVAPPASVSASAPSRWASVPRNAGTAPIR
ncbi:MAG: VanZ family protein [Gemmatimonadales bacterium]